MPAETEQLKTQAAHILKTCLEVKKDETVLVVTDTATHPAIPESLFQAALELGCEAFQLTMKPRSHHGQEPPPLVAEAMEASDVILAPTSYSLTHTQARIKACQKGARIATMPGITLKMMTQGGMTADYHKIEKTAEKWEEKLKDVKEIRITTPLGTDITFDVEDCPWMLDTGIATHPGEGTNLPGGEIYTAPKNANGTYIIDGAIGNLGLLETPLKIKVKNRKATEITGKKANKLKTLLDTIGEPAYNIAELGIGINPHSQLIGNVLEDEKVAGTIHIALGDNSMFGGDVIAGIHLDGIIKNPKLWLDGKETRLGEI